MKVTAMEEYGLRCILQLALAQTDEPVSVALVAKNEGISTEYAGKLLNLLRRAELVESVRGRKGGFVLANPPEEISLADILRVFSPELFDVKYCNRFTGAEDICVHTTSCALRPVWWTLSSLVTETLESISLMDVMCEESEVQRKLNIPLGITGPVDQRLFQISDNAQPE
ncbi:MAG: Rrf2 family transcriptional regulator [Acidobacteria bacterium]|nr:Rrf2 family transcriptional regulator [Acidobacteriota bacterium]